MQCLCNFLEIQPFLQARDGAVLDRTSERWENFPCERRCRMCSSRDYSGGYSEDMIPTVSNLLIERLFTLINQHFLSTNVDWFAGSIGRIQHEEGDQGKCYDKIMGSWWPA
ncbi:hypothetical protein GW17_00006209 [Ensete ventricosum]|nr:hypothetical protein GW17_00006209 [Ensete ventricosum]